MGAAAGGGVCFKPSFKPILKRLYQYQRVTVTPGVRRKPAGGGESRADSPKGVVQPWQTSPSAQRPDGAALTARGRREVPGAFGIPGARSRKGGSERPGKTLRRRRAGGLGTARRCGRRSGRLFFHKHRHRRRGGNTGQALAGSAHPRFEAIWTDGANEPQHFSQLCGEGPEKTLQLWHTSVCCLVLVDKSPGSPERPTLSARYPAGVPVYVRSALRWSTRWISSWKGL